MYNYDVCESIKATTTASNRTYHTPDGNFPSVTTILSGTSFSPWLQKWKDNVGEEEAERIRSEAAKRGTIVHSYVEKFWSQEESFTDLFKESRDIIKMSQDLIKLTQNDVTEIWAQELAVWNPLLKYAGRVDIVGKWKNIPAIIDLKTARKVKRITDIKDYFIQVTAYAEAHNYLFGSDINLLVILIAVEGKDPQIFESRRAYHLPDLKYRIRKYNELN